MNSALDELLRESGWSLQDFGLIAVDHGPGSFTGIRVSVSVARSLCYSLQKPCFVMDSNSILALQTQSPLVVGINAYKNLIFASLHARDLSDTEIRVLSPSQLEDWVQSRGRLSDFTFVGDAWRAYQQSWTPSFRDQIKRDPSLSDFPSASALSRQALLSSPSDWISDWKMILPLYLRESAAEENLRKP
jgi:tRNA threonylcarbamoyladenosine biosynthesis protein TsaB